MKKIIWRNLSRNKRAKVLERPTISLKNIKNEVSKIIEKVKSKGDIALFDLSIKYDLVEIDSLQVSEKEFEQAEKSLSEETIKALKEAYASIEIFHKAQKPNNLSIETNSGVLCERIFVPIQNIGLYVPAGTAPLPSTAMMLGVPAQIAKCPIKILCSPPEPDGNCNAEILFVAKMCGINNVFKVGGAQAIAAMAYGTSTIPKVDKIYGPGNAWVTEAKTQVSQDSFGLSRDMPAGPSELLVIADKSSNPNFVASDLLSQAEHGHDSQVILVTDNEKLCDKVLEEIKIQIPTRERRNIIEQSIKSSRAIVVDDISKAIEISNSYAPEHLILNVDQPRSMLSDIISAGSIFLGPWSPESIGDYCSGTNHVLPTYGYAKSISSLGVVDFMKSMTIQELTKEGIKKIGSTGIKIADLEGLDAHSYAIKTRLASLK